MSVARISDHGYFVIFGKKGAAVVEADVVEGRLRNVSPDKKVLTVPRVGDIWNRIRMNRKPPRWR